MAQNIDRKVEDGGSKFSGDETESWKEYVDNYLQFAQDYRLSREQIPQFLHNILSKYVERFLNAADATCTALFQHVYTKAMLNITSSGVEL